MAKDTKVNISGDWKLVDDIQTRVSGSWKEVRKAYTRVSGVWKVVHSFDVPTGLIIPYDGVAAPSGWDLFTAADGYHIIGAGSTYSVSDSGAGTGDLSPYSPYAGNHTGTNGLYKGGGSSTGSEPKTAVSQYAGNHRHQPASAISLITPYEQLRLIKAQAGNEVFPQDGLLLGLQDFSGLSVVKDNGRILKADTTITSNAGKTTSGSISTDDPGNHEHYGTPSQVFGSTGGLTLYANAGAHTHTVTLAITYNLLRFYLSAWTNAAAAFTGAAGMIAMYESLTPPAGWVLCDGNNGTPDLRNYFIQLDSAVNDNQSAGDGTVNFTGTTSTDGDHNHSGGTGTGTQQTIAHTNTTGDHEHIFNDDLSWLPPYYSLAFVQYTG